PDHFSVRCRVSAETAIMRTGNHGAWYQRYCSTLARSAARLRGAQARRRTRHAPDLGTSSKVYCANTARILALAISHTKVNVLSIGGGAPLTAESTALSESIFPN